MSNKKKEIEQRIARLETKIDQDMCEMYPNVYDLQQIVKSIMKDNNLKILVKNSNNKKLFIKAFFTIVKNLT